MSQPRVSRHLNLLADAGVVDKHREGTWAFFDLVTHGPDRPTGPGCPGTHRRQRQRARRRSRSADDRPRPPRCRCGSGIFRRDRAEVGRGAFAARIGRDRRAGDPRDDRSRPPTSRCSTSARAPGACCNCSAKDAKRAVGFDSSHSMLAVARANLERAEIRGVDLRQGDIYVPPFANDSFDLIVIHQVLHFLDDPARAVREISPAADARRANADRRLRAALARVPPIGPCPRASRLPRRTPSRLGSSNQGSKLRPCERSRRPRRRHRDASTASV